MISDELIRAVKENDKDGFEKLMHDESQTLPLIVHGEIFKAIEVVRNSITNELKSLRKEDSIDLR